MQVIVQNLDINYLDEGEGPVILLLHGWQDSLLTFNELTLKLSKAHRLIRLDLPGFGKSETPPSAWSLDDYVRLVSDFMAKLNVKADIIAGHSFGGRIAIKGTAGNVFQPKKLILIATAGISKSRTARNLALKVLAKTGKAVTSIPPLSFCKEKMKKKMYAAIGSDYLNAGTLKETFLKTIAEDLCQAAEHIAIPTLLIWGADDMETPLSDGKKFAQLINNSDLKVISGAGHFVHREKPTLVSELIDEFI